MSKKAQKNYAVLIYVQHLHVLDSVVTRQVSIFAFLF